MLPKESKKFLIRGISFLTLGCTGGKVKPQYISTPPLYAVQAFINALVDANDGKLSDIGALSF